MYQRYYLINALKKQALLLVLALSSMVLILSCAPQETTSVPPESINVSGMWQYEQINYDESSQQFITRNFHVGLNDNGETVTLQHCTQGMDVVFSRSKDLLVNNQGQQVQIVNENTIQSLSVPDMKKMTRTSPHFDHFNNAGSFSMQSNVIPSVNLTTNVCAQQIAQTGSNKFELIISVPFEETYLDIHLVIDDINEQNNIDLMTISSPSLRNYYSDTTQLKSLYGHATFTSLTSNHVQLDFDMTTVLFSVFPGDRFLGSINVSW